MDISSITPSIDYSAAKILATQSSAVNNSGTKTEAQIRNSAQGFERILVRQMLSTMRNPNIRGDDSAKTTSSGYLELADDNLADLLSKGKGMGFGSIIAEQLLQQANVKQLIANDKNAVNKNGTASGIAGTSGVVPPAPSIANNLANGAANQIAYQTASNSTSFITAPNTASTFLSWNGSSFTWSPVAGAGTVTSVDANGGTTGMTFTGGPITASGNLTLSGTLVIASGGTGANTAAGARTNLGLGNMALQSANVTSVSNNQLFQYSATESAWKNVDPGNVTVGTANVAVAIQGGASNQIVYQTASNATSFISAPSAANTFLTWTGSTFSWANAATAAVTSVDVNGGTTGLTFTGGPVTSSGNITMSGVLGVTAGGTGSNAAPTSGQLLIGNGTGFNLATITAGSNINITNGPGTITISSTGGSSNVSANTAYAYAWFIS